MSDAARVTYRGAERLIVSGDPSTPHAGALLAMGITGKLVTRWKARYTTR